MPNEPLDVISNQPVAVYGTKNGELLKKYKTLERYLKDIKADKEKSFSKEFANVSLGYDMLLKLAQESITNKKPFFKKHYLLLLNDYKEEPPEVFEIDKKPATEKEYSKSVVSRIDAMDNRMLEEIEAKMERGEVTPQLMEQYLRIRTPMMKRHREAAASKEKMDIYEMAEAIDKMIDRYGRKDLATLMRDVERLDDEGLLKFEKRMRAIFNDIPAVGTLEEDKETVFNYIEELKKRKYWFFTPNGQQEKFIKVIGNNTYVSVFSAANGVGKSYLGVNILANIIWDNNKKWFDYPMFNDWKYPRRGRIITSRHSVPNIEGMIKELFPKGEYIAKSESKGYKYRYICRQGTEYEFVFDVLTYTQDSSQFESETLGLTWFDEPPPQGLIAPTATRLRGGGIMFITATGIDSENSQQLYEFINRLGSLSYESIKKWDIKNPPFSAYVEGNYESACITHGVRGHLKHDDMDKIKKVLTAKDWELRSSGGLQTSLSSIFPKFTREIHVIDPFPINKEDFSVIASIDYHSSRSDAVVYVATNRKSEAFVIAEKNLDFVSLDDYVRTLKKLEEDNNMRIVRRVVDPSMDVRDKAHSEKGNMYQRLNNIGFIVVLGSKLRDDCERLINDRLDFRKHEDIMVNPPKLYIFNNCIETIDSIQNAHFKEDGKRSKKNDDFAEALGRAIFEGSDFITTELSHEGFYADSFDTYMKFDI